MQDQQNEPIGQVTRQIAELWGELSGVKKDIASTRVYLSSTKVKSDLRGWGLDGTEQPLACTHADLKELGHRADRTNGRMDHYDHIPRSGATKLDNVVPGHRLVKSGYEINSIH